MTRHQTSAASIQIPNNSHSPLIVMDFKEAHDSVEKHVIWEVTDEPLTLSFTPVICLDCAPLTPHSMFSIWTRWLYKYGWPLMSGTGSSTRGWFSCLTQVSQQIESRCAHQCTPVLLQCTGLPVIASRPLTVSMPIAPLVCATHWVHCITQWFQIQSSNSGVV